jgi:hypothetical protein
MGLNGLIVGKSGSGKSSLLRNMPRDKVGVFNVAGKPFPFPGKFEMMATTSDVDAIIESLKRNVTNCYVIDDSQYLMAFKLIDKWQENGYSKYTEIARDWKRLIDTIVYKTSPDTIVYFLHHTESMDDGSIKAKTCGKMIDNWLTLEGLFSIVLMTVATESKHMVITQSDGTNTCKSPIDMFDNPIDNDLLKIDARIREYYGLAPLGLRNVKEEKKTEKAEVSKVDKIPGGEKK